MNVYPFDYLHQNDILDINKKGSLIQRFNSFNVSLKLLTCSSTSEHIFTSKLLSLNGSCFKSPTWIFNFGLSFLAKETPFSNSSIPNFF